MLAAKATASLVFVLKNFFYYCKFSLLDPPLSDNELWDLGSVLTQQILQIAREKAGLKTVILNYFFLIYFKCLLTFFGIFFC